MGMNMKVNVKKTDAKKARKGKMSKENGAQNAVARKQAKHAADGAPQKGEKLQPMSKAIVRQRLKASPKSVVAKKEKPIRDTKAKQSTKTKRTAGVRSRTGAASSSSSQQQRREAALKVARSFASFDDFYAFLGKKQTHLKLHELWLRIYKKGSGKKSIDWQGAVCAALCWGWIDSQVYSVADAEYYIQRFTPRRSKSLWSKKNVANVERLSAEGKMKKFGLDKVKEAKEDGRWDRAYDSKSHG